MTKAIKAIKAIKIITHPADHLSQKRRTETAQAIKTLFADTTPQTSKA
jgi:hypothetical protein